jgi:hypothetical protein
MPFGLDLKSIIVGALFAMFVLPWVQAMIMRPRAERAAA